jgi:2-oxoglutarate ferredoxin oxidoreductase subunit beta
MTIQAEILRVDGPKDRPVREVGERKPDLLLTGEHKMCAGCGEPIAARILLEVLAELGMIDRTIAVFGIGCYTLLTHSFDIEIVQAMHGRAPSLATGVKRMLPDSLVFTLQGDGDMVNEGLQEIIHTAARGENVTAILVNNGVFGETGGHMTAATVLGQRTKNTLEGRDAAQHGYPIRISELIAGLDGATYVARGSVHNIAGIAATKKMLREAFLCQAEKRGFSFVEILTMCPTGWFVPTVEGPDYMHNTLGQVNVFGELKTNGSTTKS